MSNGTGAGTKFHGRTAYNKYTAMDLYYGPLEKLDLVTYFGFTLNISPHRKLGGIYYKKLARGAQEQTLLDISHNAFMDVVGEPPESYIFEDTEKGNRHLHGICYATEFQLLLIQQRINEQLAFKSDRIDQTFNYSRTLIHRKFWDKYMMKDQKPNGLFYEYDDDGYPAYNMFIEDSN